MSFKCYCCSLPFPDLYKNEHHKIPEAMGGKNTPDNKVDLCAGCHDLLHAIAYKLRSKKVSLGSVQDQLLLIYKENTNAIKTCFHLATLVREAMIVAEEKGVSPDQLTQISTIIRKRHKDLLAVICQDHKISQESFLRSLILRELRRFYPKEPLDNEELIIKNIKKSTSRS